MKFVCERCHTRYSIADDKVRQKILKIRCKTCENVITVRDPASSAPEPPVSEAQPAATTITAQANRLESFLANRMFGVLSRLNGVDSPSKQGSRGPQKVAHPVRTCMWLCT